jgi:CheY-like chemotaxis protein
VPERIRILLASPDSKALLAQARMIRLRGWDHVSAGDAANAVAQSRGVQAAVLDPRLPGDTALAALRRLRSSVSTAAIPVLMAGHCGEAEQSRFRAEGATEVLPDALAADAIGDCLQRHLAQPATVLQAPASVLAAPGRLAALRLAGLLDAPPEASYDRITALVCRLLGTPTSVFTVVDPERQFFKSAQGLAEPVAAARQTPLSHSFCQWVVSGREPVCVDDARDHDVLRSNLAVSELGVVAYAGVPVLAADGEALGSLCAVDGHPRAWHDEDEATLQDLARLVEACIVQAVLARQEASDTQVMAHAMAASGLAIEAGTALLRRHGDALGAADRDELLAMVAGHGRHLMGVSRRLLPAHVG